jgi:Sugar (and other) transporter
VLTAPSRIWNFLLAFFTPFITSAIGFSYGFVFAGCNLVGAIVVYFFLYESSGHSLENVDNVSPLPASKNPHLTETPQLRCITILLAKPGSQDTGSPLRTQHDQISVILLPRRRHTMWLERSSISKTLACGMKRQGLPSQLVMRL